MNAARSDSSRAILGSLGALVVVLGAVSIGAVACSGKGTTAPAPSSSSLAPQGGSSTASSAALPPASASSPVPSAASSSSAPPAVSGDITTCSKDEDCAWGEIQQELTARVDCPCLLGCPGILMNRTTLERRSAQYHALCEPRVDGKGRSCPIDDCSMPPKLTCAKGTCRVP